MSRSGYSDDCDHIELWRAAVDAAVSGKRGQAFLRELLGALDAMRAAKGSVRDAAAALGVHEGSLSRWLRLPQLAKAAALRQGREAVGARSKKRARR